MSKRVLCKFFAHGACLKGEHCQFSHSWTDEPNNVCTFYQKGVCSYGSRCRYDHVKVSRHQTSGRSASSSSSTLLPRVTSNSVQLGRSFEAPSSAEWKSNTVQLGRSFEAPSSAEWESNSVQLGHSFEAPSSAEWESNSIQLGRSFEAPSSAEWEPPLSNPIGLSAFSAPFVMPTLYETSALEDNECDSRPTSLADQPICSFAAAGHCPYGERCPHIHGDLCPICGKCCLHPYRPDEREEHIKLCEKNNKRIEALKLSQKIECSVCLERVLSKSTAAERKFGLLSECDHPFCVTCIRNWRSNSPASGMDVNAALRACPICRKLSYFVIPSVIWYATNEEKEEIVDSYKAKLKSIDCKYFDFGNGTCPFGTSCFYKHTYKPYTNRMRTNRPRPYQPSTNQPRSYRPRQVVIEQELQDLARLVIEEEELRELDGLNMDDELVDFDGEDVDSFLEMTFLLMQFGLNDIYSSSDEGD